MHQQRPHRKREQDDRRHVIFRGDTVSLEHPESIVREQF